MNVIITWSGNFSKGIAVFLREWLAEVMPAAKPWVSSEDIQKGKKWFQELMEQFKETHVSLICITPENVLSPWVYYEVGLIAANQDDGIVCPFLVGVPGKLIAATPLAQFQWTQADKQDTWKLIQSINKALKEQGYDEKVLQGNFNSHWGRLKNRLEKFINEMGDVEEEITQIHQPRLPELSQTAKELLVAASKDKNGDIMLLRTSLGFTIQTAQRQMLASQEPREVARWKGALEKLVELGYVQDRGNNGEIFEITNEGFERVDELLATDPVYSLSDEAKQILVDASEADDGLVFFVKGDSGFQIMTNKRQFVEDSNPKQAANWKHGFDQLIGGGLLESRGDQDVYRATKKGYEMAKELCE